MLIDDPIVIDFNHNVDPNTLTDETITLKNAMTMEPVEKTISFDPLNVYSVTLTPSAPLQYGTEYVVEFSPAVTDIAGFTIADPVTFTTQENRGVACDTPEAAMNLLCRRKRCIPTLKYS